MIKYFTTASRLHNDINLTAVLTAIVNYEKRRNYINDRCYNVIAVVFFLFKLVAVLDILLILVDKTVLGVKWFSFIVVFSYYIVRDF